MIRTKELFQIVRLVLAVSRRRSGHTKTVLSQPPADRYDMSHTSGAGRRNQADDGQNADYRLTTPFAALRRAAREWEVGGQGLI